jgi:hypothetical protein
MDYQRLVLERCDPDQLVAVIDGTEMRHRILPAGALNVRIEKLHLGSGVVQSGRYGMGVLADGALPGGGVTVGFILDAPAEEPASASATLRCAGGSSTWAAFQRTTA